MTVRISEQFNLGFLKFRILTVGRVTSVELRHRAKFRRNRSNRGRDMCFNIMRVWLENAYSCPFLGVFWGTFPEWCHSSS